MSKILCVFGTRPEAIKMAPVIEAIRRLEPRPELRVCVTAQHRAMLDQVLDLFSIKPDYDLDIMTQAQSLYDVTARVIKGMESVLSDCAPDLALVHGDTTTTFAAALSAFYKKVPVGHVEAGLRTHDRYSPWPEELNRQLTSKLATYHFSPTPAGRENLIREGISADCIVVTGNTVIDALLQVRERLGSDPAFLESSRAVLRAHLGLDLEGTRFVLVTGHRRENFGKPFEQICGALRELSARFPNDHIVYPVHFNPAVRGPVMALLGDVPNVHLIPPLEYAPFVYLMARAYIVLTDSGGLQEEAPSLGKPVLVMRESTERPEAVDAGTVRLVGSDPARIVAAISRLLTDDKEYARMAQAVNPYGDGRASLRIADFVAQRIECGR